MPARDGDHQVAEGPQRLQLGPGVAGPEGQGRAVQLDALPYEGLRLAVQGTVVGIFGDQYLGHQPLGRQPALAGAGACTTVPAQPRQAYLGRRVTRIRYWAGTTSSRRETSSPIRCSGPLQQGQVVLPGSITTSTWGR